MSSYNNEKPFSKKAHWGTVLGFLGLGTVLWIRGFTSGDLPIYIVFSVCASAAWLCSGLVAIFDKPPKVVQ